MSTPGQTLTEEEFLRLKNGDGAVFRKVYDAYFGLIHYVANRCGLRSAEARDVVQDTFVKLYEKAASLQDVDGLKSWLVITAKNHAIDILRKQKTQRHLPLDELKDETAVDESGQALWYELQVHVVRDLVEEISADTGDHSFRLFYVEGKSAREIAELNNEPISTVTNRISRMRARFKEKFKRHLDALRDM